MDGALRDVFLLVDLDAAMDDRVLVMETVYQDEEMVSLDLMDDPGVATVSLDLMDDPGVATVSLDSMDDPGAVMVSLDSKDDQDAVMVFLDSKDDQDAVMVFLVLALALVFQGAAQGLGVPVSMDDRDEDSEPVFLGEALGARDVVRAFPGVVLELDAQVSMDDQDEDLAQDDFRHHLDRHGHRDRSQSQRKHLSPPWPNLGSATEFF